MDRFARIVGLHRILSTRRLPVSLKTLSEKLECSTATTKRAIAEARYTLGAPIVYDREHNGYRYEDGRFEMPGLWFSPDELHALSTSLHLLKSLEPGVLGPWIEPLRSRLEDTLQRPPAGHHEIMRRVRVLQLAPRPVQLEHFQQVASALVERRRIRVFYHGRERDQLSERTISPQRLVYYRDNWYLDAWCHWRRALRSFSLDRLHPVETLDHPAAREIGDDKLDGHFTEAYGIFAGKPRHTAVLRFSGSRARWVADEQWHPRQQMKILPDGGCELRVPYADDRELVMDILKYGADVEVMGPKSLRRKIAEMLREAAGRYGDATRSRVDPSETEEC